MKAIRAENGGHLAGIRGVSTTPGMAEFRALQPKAASEGLSLVMSPSGEKPRSNRRLGGADGEQPRAGYPKHSTGLLKRIAPFARQPVITTPLLSN